MPNFEAIAQINCDSCELYEVPNQGSLKKLQAEIIFNDNIDPQALEDLKGVERIWILFHFHLAHNWKNKVSPPRGENKISLFATRSPHRPNPIGLSCVELLAIKRRKLIIQSHDLVHGTPVLDIKPYIPYADSFPNSKAGWVDSVQEHKHFDIQWSKTASSQIQWLNKNSRWPLKRLAGQILSTGIRPDKDRIKPLDEKKWELACKSWRLSCSINSHNQIVIHDIYSGYSPEVLNTTSESPWNDLKEHREFNKLFKEHQSP